MNGLDLFHESGRNLQRAVQQEQELLAAASEVVWLRTLQFFSGRMSPQEAAIMVLEKPLAFAHAARRAGIAAAHGRDPLAIARAAVDPLRSTALSNAVRLRG